VRRLAFYCFAHDLTKRVREEIAWSKAGKLGEVDVLTVRG